MNLQDSSADWHSTRQLDYHQSLKDLDSLDSQLSSCMSQYEERLKRVNDYLEQSNQCYLRVQEDMKALRVKHEGELRERDLYLQRLIAKSIDIKNQVMTIDEKHNQRHLLSPAVLAEMLSELELQISKLAGGDLRDETVLGAVRDHLIEVYQRVGCTLLRRQGHYDELLQRQESEWRATCDRLMEDHQAMRDQRD